MAEEASKPPGPFDVKTIKQLVGLMSQHDLSEIELCEGDQRIRLRRGLHRSMAAPGASLILPAAGPSYMPPPLPPSPANEHARPAKLLTPIKSPTPGTFYSAAKPGSEPYIKVGSKVTPSTVVCMIEAMKIFNEITADCTGVITDILVDNQQAVEYGQVLFQVDPTT